MKILVQHVIYRDNVQSQFNRRKGLIHLFCPLCYCVQKFFQSSQSLGQFLFSTNKTYLQYYTDQKSTNLEITQQVTGETLTQRHTDSTFSYKSKKRKMIKQQIYVCLWYIHAVKCSVYEGQRACLSAIMEISFRSESTVSNNLATSAAFWLFFCSSCRIFCSTSDTNTMKGR